MIARSCLGLSFSESGLHVVYDNGVIGIKILKQGLGVTLIAEATARLIPGIERVMLSAAPLTNPT